MISHKKHKLIQLESSEGNLMKFTLDLRSQETLLGAEEFLEIANYVPGVCLPYAHQTL